MKDKFTKGPWSTCEDNNIVTCKTGRIAYTFSGESIPYLNKRVANANLIKRAPEMYELLENIRQALEWGDNESDTGENVLEYLPEIIDLLAKARGE